jgi:DNA-binding transcriptional LysR family regulator
MPTASRLALARCGPISTGSLLARPGDCVSASFNQRARASFPAVLPRFRQQWPNIDISLHNRSELPDIERAVMAGEVDLAFYELDTISPALDSVELLVDPYVVVLPRNHPLAQHTELNWRDLENLDRISHSGRDVCSVVIGKALRDAGVTTNVVFETDDNLTLQRLVGVGLGIGVVASLAVEPITDDNTIVIPLATNSRLARRIGLVWHRDRYRSPSALGFIAVAQEAVAAGL